MATHHASPAEIVDLGTWAQDVPYEQTKAIVKTEEITSCHSQSASNERIY